MNENLHCFDSNFFDNQRNSDHLLRIATDIAAAGYLGVVIHAEPLAAGVAPKARGDPRPGRRRQPDARLGLLLCVLRSGLP